MPLRWVTMNHFWRPGIILWLAAGMAHARAVRIVVEYIETVGAYMKQTGRFFGELEPVQPPIVKRTILMLVPQTESDGNEIGGVPSVLHPAPLGTYLGWNLTTIGYLKGRACGFSGGMTPFARTRAEREALGDTRPSLEERYGTRENYVAHVKAAAQGLVEERFLVQEDADRLVREAEASGMLR